MVVNLTIWLMKNLCISSEVTNLHCPDCDGGGVIIGSVRTCFGGGIVCLVVGFGLLGFRIVARC